MADGWRRVPLDSVVRFQEGPGILAKDFHPEGVPLVRLAGLGGYEVTLEKCNYLDPSLVAKKWDHFRLAKGDILISTSASFGRPAVVGADAEGAVFYTGIIRFQSVSSDLDDGYLKSFLGSRAFMLQAEAQASGSVISHFGPSHLRRMEIPLPPLEQQLDIAHVHSVLDDKIELNRRMNGTLEAMARAIFKDWFVDFGPSRAKAEGGDPYLAPELWDLFPDALDEEDKPVGWETFTLADLAHHHRATVSPSADPEHTFEHYSIPAYDAGNEPSLDSGSSIKSNKTVVPEDAVLLSKLNPDIERVWLPNPKGELPQVASTEFLAFTPRSNATRTALFCLFKSEGFRAEMAAMVTGTSKSHQRVSPKTLLTREVLTADRQLLSAFDEMARPCLDRLLVNRREARTLAQIRDLLLPKLMSGEMRLAEADRAVEVVA